LRPAFGAIFAALRVFFAARFVDLFEDRLFFMGWELPQVEDLIHSEFAMFYSIRLIERDAAGESQA
jgi:hypothetical protein